MRDQLQIVWLKTGPLHPVDTGGKIRTFNMLRELKKRHRITYVALCPPEVNEQVKQSAAEYSHEQVWIPWRETKKFSVPFFAELAGNFFLSPLPYVIQKYESPDMGSAVRGLDQARKHDLMVCDFLTPAVNLLAGDARPATKTLLFQHNVESLIWKRTWENTSGLKRAYFQTQWRRMERFERDACSRVNAVAGVSDEDCSLLRTEFGLTNVVGSVPTGVDIEYHQPPKGERKPRSLAFLGSMDWMPNIDSVVFFCREIFPRLKQEFPNVTLTIIGRNPPTQVKELAANDSSIRVTGTVPDVRPLLAEAEVMIVPLRIGGGTRIKIFEAMASGIPVVSTRIGAEGLPVTHGENILLADTPTDFARVVADLFVQPDLRGRMGQAGLELVRKHYSWESVTSVFEKYCLDLCGGGKS
jgi:glycosyltransferase involved in cell wall biosynthesis